MPEDTITGFVHQSGEGQGLKPEGAALEKSGEWSIVLTKSTGQPEQATTSQLVETADRSRERDPSSPDNSEEGSSLRQTRTRHNSVPFQNRRDMKRLTLLSSNSMAKHCSAATHSAISLIAQLNRCWKIVWKTDECFKNAE